MPEQREVISVSVPPELAARLRTVAKEQDRTVSALLRRAARQALDSHNAEVRA
ncbi:MAG TPA: ribbon-helix-helix protein, CopG family [Solirubrobacterales bacterium]|nr:ribbon-helix-helix protein, CopG family [Solirubrobacterales bacterium]